MENTLDSPAVRYYRHHHGHWQGSYAFEIKSWATFWNAKLGVINRLALLSLAYASRLGLRIVMRTTLDAQDVDSGRVVHTTQIGKFGIPFYASREVFELNEDGVTMQLARVQRLWPFPFWPLPEDFGSGSVNSDAEGASYDWLWYDRRMTQKTSKEAEGLRLNQDSDWSFATVLLTRVPRL